MELLLIITSVVIFFTYNEKKKQSRLQKFQSDYLKILRNGSLITEASKKSLSNDLSYLRRALSTKKQKELISEEEFQNSILKYNMMLTELDLKCADFLRLLEDSRLTGIEHIYTRICEFEDVYKEIKANEFIEPIIPSIRKAVSLYEQISTATGLKNVEIIQGNINKFNSFFEKPLKRYCDYNDRKKISKYNNTRKYIHENKTIISILFNEQKVSKFNNYFNNLDTNIDNKNNEFVKVEMEKHSEFFDNINGYSLDVQQRKAIVTNELNCLYVAGAGAGKTLTVVANVRYLVEKRGVAPEDILLISFTNKAVDELEERISKSNDYKVDTLTFHKLGLSILASSSGKKPAIFSDDQAGLIKTLLLDVIQNNDGVMEKFVLFMALYYVIPQDPNEFKTKSAYFEDLRRQELISLKGRMHEYEAEGRGLMTTLRGERIKSIEELIIANFLYIHGINYEYEKPYTYDTSDSIYRQYYPDFYLPDYDIWYEHFGLDRDGRAKWLNAFEEKKYTDGVKWKRNLHAQNGTVLIETYSYYSAEGNLVENLTKVLEENGIEINPIDGTKISELITREKRGRQFENFSRLMSTFIQLLKSNGFNEKDISIMQEEATKAGNWFIGKREMMMLTFAKIIFSEYQSYLGEKRMIDFADMINQATKAVKSNEAKLTYKYIFIDEYQDIAVGRFKLIKAIREQSDAKVIAVGDDWQSIYRFAGSDIGMFMNFDKYFGKTETLMIESTYRNSKELTDIAGSFIQKNPSQIKKKLKSDINQDNPVEIVEAEYSNILSTFTATILEINKQNPVGEILVLGRNNYNKNILLESGLYSFTDKDELIYGDDPSIKMKFLTVHRSKGLESDNVVILNVINHSAGFPNQIADDPILRFVLNKTGDYRFDEERRLFYVALTRTKKKVYIITQPFKHSEFVDELIEDYQIPIRTIVGGYENVIEGECPKCGGRQLRINSGPYGRFVGCGNYPLCDYKHKDLIAIKNNKKCPVCGDYMVKRSGRYGEFYGCNNYPFCNNTEKIMTS